MIDSEQITKIESTINRYKYLKCRIKEFEEYLSTVKQVGCFSVNQSMVFLESRKDMELRNRIERDVYGDIHEDLKRISEVAQSYLMDNIEHVVKEQIMKLQFELEALTL